MNSKRTWRVLATAALLATAAVVGAPSSQAAAADCSVKADLPATVSVHYSYQKIPVHLYGCEGILDWSYGAFVEIYHPGYSSYLDYTSGTGRNTYWSFYDFEVTPGTYQTASVSGYDIYGNPVGLTVDYSTLKFATAAGINASRSGSYVTLGMVAWRYGTATSSMIRYAYATVTVQHRVPGSTYWSNLATVKLNSAGRATLTKYAPATRDYRILVPTSGSFWGSASPVVRK